jgi:hypothetical protein
MAVRATDEMPRAFMNATYGIDSSDVRGEVVEDPAVDELNW